MYSLYTILGIPENSPTVEIERAYRGLKQRLRPEDFPAGSLGETQCRQCVATIEEAYRRLTDPEELARYQEDFRKHIAEDTEIQPRLGQLCVAAGVISFEELQRAVEAQERLDLPIGQVLQEHRLITQAELDGLLLGQKLIDLPPESPHSVGQRLIALGLVSEDMVRIALIEQRTFDKRLGELLVAHGWMDKRLLETLLQDNPITASLLQ